MPVRLSSQLVTVVPTLLPMMMPTAWCSCMMPLLTKPTTITVVAEELWITAVTPRPSRKPLRGLSLSLERMTCSLPPACCSSDSPIRFIPYKKRARPPIRVNRLKMLMVLDSSFLYGACAGLAECRAPGGARAGADGRGKARMRLPLPLLYSFLRKAR